MMTDSTEQYRLACGSAVVCAIAMVGFLAIYAEASTFGREAAIFPRLTAVLGIASAGFALAQSLGRIFRMRRAGVVLGAGDPVSLTDLFISYGGPPLYGALIAVLGFWIASALSLAGLLVALGERRPVPIIALTVFTLGVIYGVFVAGFNIRMPGSLVFNFLPR